MQVSSGEKEEVAWTPDLVGPIFKKDGVTLREALSVHYEDKRTRLMASFVPDELIYGIDFSRKDCRRFNAAFLLVDLSSIFGLHEGHANGENGGAYGLIGAVNNYVGAVIEEICSSDGDVLKLSVDGLLALWKVRGDGMTFRTVHDVILCSQRIQQSVNSKDTERRVINVSTMISAGDVTFSVIGNEKTRRPLVAGKPIDDLKHARRVCLPGDLVLSSSAWEHCAPSQYEFVIKDSDNVKITKVLGPAVKTENLGRSSSTISSQVDSQRCTVVRPSLASISAAPRHFSISVEEPQIVFTSRLSMLQARRRQLGGHLKSYVAKPVLQQIEKDELVEHLTETRRSTVVFVNVIPNKGSVFELVSLVDRIFLQIESAVEDYAGYVNVTNLYDKNILFCATYGLTECHRKDERDTRSTSKSAISAAKSIQRMLKRTEGVKAVSIGVSTGMVYCGVIGHPTRRQYVVIGPPVDRAMGMIDISYDKITCDYDTVLYSGAKDKKFRCRGVKDLHRVGKCRIYEFIGDTVRAEGVEGTSNLDYCYPVLGRLEELECFKDVLDEIGVVGRKYSGLLVEGCERSGKSRLLDAFVTVLRDRQIRTIELSLHPSYEEKAYAALYHILLLLLDAEDCKTIEERERILSSRFSVILPSEHFCYLNAIMRVQFPLSRDYSTESDWRRHRRTMQIFEAILNQIGGRLCVLLDDVQHMDFMSWQFLSIALNVKSTVFAMTMAEPKSWDDLSQTCAEICKDKRLMKRTSLGFDSKYLAAFACQFLNVLAISKSLETTLTTYSNDEIAWCEAFLILTLRAGALNFVTISPDEVTCHDLVFPDGSLLTKVPRYSMPEELAPPLHWKLINNLNVCVTNERYLDFVDVRRDVAGLRIDVYDRLNPYEQYFIKCAATLGPIFSRNSLQSVMTHSTPLHTNKTVAEMIRIRILECAMIQRKDFPEDLTFCTFKMRSTFSDMHHLLTCDCRSSRALAGRSLPLYSHCKILEFKSGAYRKAIYEMLSSDERRECHAKAATVFEENAGKCESCGGGGFLRFPSSRVASSQGNVNEERRNFPRLTTLQRRSEPRRRSILSVGGSEPARRRESVSARRLSVLPSHLEDDENEFSGMGSGSETKKRSVGLSKAFRRRRVSFATKTTSDLASYVIDLTEFGHVDYRNCQCGAVTSCLFWEMDRHIRNSGSDAPAVSTLAETKKVLSFMAEYGAGLIRTGQPSFAIKVLTAAKELARTRESEGPQASGLEDTIFARGIILVSMGDACMALGNYSQATKLYNEAATLRSGPLYLHKNVCYNLAKEKLQDSLRRGCIDYPVDRVQGSSAVIKLELASHLRRLSAALMTEEKRKVASLTVLGSIRHGFESAGCFHEKGEIYLNAVRVYRVLGNMKAIRDLEKPMTSIIRRRTSWNDAEDVLLVSKIFRTMYEIRALKGELEPAVEMAHKALRISGKLNASPIKLSILPSLIEIMVWTKHVNQAVDLMRELYYLADDDVDDSAITWYYAISLELLLDAGIILETYETCYEHFQRFNDRQSALRDPESLSRLTTCIFIWQLRMATTVNETFLQSIESYTKDIEYDNFAQIFNCVKVLESYLLVLLRRVNIKQSNDIADRLRDVERMIKILDRKSKSASFVKPFVYLLKSYLDVLRGRKYAWRMNLRRSRNCSRLQSNRLILAWIAQNKRTWKDVSYNNMAQYWVEYIGTADGVRWQNIHDFDLDSWSTILYPFPLPDHYL